MAVKSEQIFELYYQDVYRYLLSYCRDTSLAEELAAQVFLEAVRSLVRFYVDTGDGTPEYAARLMLEIRRVMDQAGVRFRGLDLVLREPLKENESRDTGLQVEAFPYEDIFEEGLEERILEAHLQLEEKYAAMDQKKAAEINEVDK